jgi:hypothetical protein
MLLIDHMAHVREGEKYQNKKAFGSVYKTNLVRSSIQVEFRSKDDDGTSITLRHQKCNVGPLQDPVGVRVEFDRDTTTFTTEPLSIEELAAESKLNAKDRIKMALQEGPMFPDEIADATGLEVDNVKNVLTKLRKAGAIEDTGQINNNRAKQVRLSSSSSSHTLRDDDDDDYSTKKVDNHTCVYLSYPCRACNEEAA